MQEVEREILLSFWKVHILHHASEEPIHGHWIISELRRHGYEISPGTLYPMLGRLVERGWLNCQSDRQRGKRARKDYRLTPKGKSPYPDTGTDQELYEEVVLDIEHHHGGKNE